MIYRVCAFVILLIACSDKAPTSSNCPNFQTKDTITVSGTIYVSNQMDQVQRYTMYARYDNNDCLIVQGPTNSAGSYTITFQNIKLGVPEGHENGVVSFRVNVDGTKGNVAYHCSGSTLDTFKVNQKVFQIDSIKAYSCRGN